MNPEKMKKLSPEEIRMYSRRCENQLGIKSLRDLEARLRHRAGDAKKVGGRNPRSLRAVPPTQEGKTVSTA